MMSNKSSTAINHQKKTGKSRKYTAILSLCFMLLLAMLLIVLLAPWAADVKQVDASFAITVDQFMYENAQIFLLWRIFIYGVFIVSTYYFLKKRLKEKGEFHIVRQYTARILAYMIIFELFVVQNVFMKAISLFTV